MAGYTCANCQKTFLENYRDLNLVDIEVADLPNLDFLVRAKEFIICNDCANKLFYRMQELKKFPNCFNTGIAI